MTGLGSQTRVGLLVLAALLVFATVIFTLGRQERLWERKVRYEIHLARAGGLQSGAQVSLGGVVVGSVESLAFPRDVAARYIEVRIAVAGEVAPRIREDTVATVRTLGLLGDRYIELSAGTPERAPIPAGGLIPAIDPLDYEAVLGQSGDIVTNVVEVSTALRDVLQTIQRGEGLLGAMLANREFGDATLRDFADALGNVRTTSARLETILTRVDRGEGLLGRLVRDTPATKRLVARLEHSLREMEGLATRLGGGRGLAVRLVEDRAYAERVLDDLAAAVAAFRRVLERIERGEGTLGRLVNDPTLYEDARSLVSDVRASWLVSLYRAVAGLWPFDSAGDGAAEAREP